MINAQVFLIHYLCESQIFHNLKRNITQQKRRPTAPSQPPSFILYQILLTRQFLILPQLLFRLWS